MAIVIRILSLPVFCSFALQAQAVISCRAGEEIVREDVSLEVAGRAALTIEGPCRVVIRRATIMGNRTTNPQPQALPPYDRRFADHYRANGLLLIGNAEAVVEDSTFSGIAAFPILASGVGKVRILRCRFRDSGSRDAKSRNNATGGVLLEDGTTNFVIADSTFFNILGNAAWTHSRYNHVRNGPGVIRRNEFDTIGRDAIQVGHASAVDVADNVIARVGYPVDAVDVEGGGTPVGIDTAGNVDSSNYVRNRMTEINGKCIDLDGFHHGAVAGNSCVNAGKAADYPFGHFGVVMNNTNPDMQSVGIRIEDNRFEGMRFGGIFVIGSGHVIRKNVMTRLHTAHCSDAAAQPGCTHFAGEPDLLRTGIYLGRRAERPALTRGNRIEGNAIRGWRMDRKCIGFAPGVDPKDNHTSGNLCRHEPD
ncbi:MAG: right-handed parallel beta-helix repeat-containing protein [Bryobacteraceae bacterium]